MKVHFKIEPNRHCDGPTTACRAWYTGKYIATFKKSEVTCKNCLKYLEAR